MDYLRIYNGMIEKAISEDRSKGMGFYFEDHHIIPVCLGGSNKKSNKVLLTGKEHFIAHKLLIEIYPGNEKLVYAVWCMVHKFGNKNERIYNIGSREYERLKSLYKESLKDFKHTDDTKQKISMKCRGLPSPMKGKRLSEESKKLISEKLSGDKNPNYRVSSSEEVLLKRSKSMRGKNVGKPSARKGKTLSDGERQKISEGVKEYWRVKKLNKEFHEER